MLPAVRALTWPSRAGTKSRALRSILRGQSALELPALLDTMLALTRQPAGLKLAGPVSCGATLLTAVRMDHEAGSSWSSAHRGLRGDPCSPHSSLLASAKLLRILTRLASPCMAYMDDVMGATLRGQLRERTPEGLRASYEQAVAARVAATQAAVQVLACECVRVRACMHARCPRGTCHWQPAAHVLVAGTALARVLVVKGDCSSKPAHAQALSPEDLLAGNEWGACIALTTIVAEQSGLPPRKDLPGRTYIWQWDLHCISRHLLAHSSDAVLTVQHLLSPQMAYER